MTIKEVIEMLENLRIKHGEDLEVVMMSDSEGNNWSKMDEAYGLGYISEGDENFYDEDDMNDMIESGEATLEEFEQVITLWRQ